MEKLPFNTWEYQEQTKLKHKVFQEYFDKWVKILGNSFKVLNYVDGFAGIGAYKNGNEEVHFGSPVIATDIIKNNTNLKKASLILIDKDPKAISNLKKVMKYNGIKEENGNGISIYYENTDFNTAIDQILKVGKNIAPTFVFIDPFGFRDVKYKTIKNIMSKVSRPEILITFMYNAITRFLEEENLEETYNGVFGTDEWKEILNAKKGREEKIIKLYVSQLKKTSTYVFPYRLTFPRKRRTYYYLIHLTNHRKGNEIMKSSFAKYSHGRVEWLGIHSDQLKLTELGHAKLEEIKSLLVGMYNNRSLRYHEIIDDQIDSTEFLVSEIRKAIMDLESKGVVYVERFPKQTKIRDKVRISLQENDIIYFNSYPSIKRKSLLYRTKVEYGNFTINHIFGCAHGCRYPCYAMMMGKSYGKINDYEDWIHPRIVSNAMELLDKEIPKYRKEIRFVHLSFTTDPFMYDPMNKRTYPPIKKLTLQVIEKLNRAGIRCTVLTKGIYPRELIEEKRYSKENEYGITLVSLDKKFKKEYEPFSAPFDERIKALQLLSKMGLKTWVSIEPYPTPNTLLNSKAGKDLDEILEAISFVDKIIFGKMNYNTTSSRFNNQENFYWKCVDKVKQFSKEKGIEYHIKEGTPGYNSKTKRIFKEG